MLQIIKELLSVKSIVGLEVTREWFGAVQLSGSPQSPEIERIAWHQIIDAEKPENELRGFLEKENFKPETLVTGLPTPAAVIREITLPLENTQKIEKIIKFQMEPFVPFAIDEMIVDFVLSRIKGQVLALGVKKTDLAEHLQRFSKINLEPRVIGLADLALFFLYSRIQPDPEHKPIGLIHFNSKYQTIQIICQKRLDLIRVLQGGGDPLAPIQETIALYQLKNPDNALQEILITGEAALPEDLPDRISALTGIKATLWKPFDHFKFGTQSLTPELQARLSVPLGLAIGALNGSNKVLNLRKEEFRIKTAAELKNRTIFMMVALLVLLTLLSLNLWYDVHAKQSSQKQLEAQIRKIYLETFPEGKNVPPGSEKAEMEKQINQKIAQYQWIDEMTAQGTVLEVIQTLTDIISKEPNVRLDNISVEEGKTVHIDGVAPSFKAVDNLKENLAKNKTFKNVNLVSAKMETLENKDKALKFNFVLERN
jgi:Tfp pilus assembly PilM family ATPase/Tfp pilus assembly protein PilN